MVNNTALRSGVRAKTLLALFVLVFGLSLVIGAHVITLVGGGTEINVVEDVSTFYNISINNSDSGQDANITQVNITLPSGFSFDFGEENGSSVTGQVSNTSDTLTWENSTDYLINGSEVHYIWFNATAANPGNYNISVATVNASGISYSNISVSVNDTTAPNITFGGSTFGDGTTLDQTTLTVELNGTDNGEIGSIVVALHYSNGTVINTTTNTTVSNSVLYSITFSGLEYGTYMVNASVNDSIGFSNITGNRTVTLANLTEEEEESSSSGSSSGSTYVPSFWKNTYSYNDVEFSEKDPVTRDLAKQNRVRLRINGETHYVGIINFTSDTVVVNVSSTPQQATIPVGESVKFDVDEDDYYDILVFVNNISSNKASVTLFPIHEEIALELDETEPEVDAVENEEGAEGTTGDGQEVIEEGEMQRSSVWIWIIVVLVVVAAGCAVYYYFKLQRNKESKKSKK